MPRGVHAPTGQGVSGADFVTTPNATGPASAPTATRWGAGRIVGVSLASVLLLVSLAALTGGVLVGITDRVARDADGFITSGPIAVSADGYAVVTEDFRISNDSMFVDLPERIVGEVRVTATGREGPVFLGIADTTRVESYLHRVAHSTVVDIADDDRVPTFTTVGGGAPGPPTHEDFWQVSASGTGPQVVRMSAAEGEWTLVVMNADGHGPVAADLRMGATVPVLTDLAISLLLGGGLLVVVGVLGLWAVLRGTKVPPD